MNYNYDPNNQQPENQYSNPNQNIFHQENQNGYSPYAFGDELPPPIQYHPPKQRNSCLIAVIIVVIIAIVIALITAGVIAVINSKDNEKKTESSYSVSISESSKVSEKSESESSKTVPETSKKSTEVIRGDKSSAPEGMNIQNDAENIGEATALGAAPMYMKPDITSDLIVTVPKDTVMPFFGYCSDWSYVKYTGDDGTIYYGYIDNYYLSSYIYYEPYLGSLTIKTDKASINMLSYPAEGTEILAEIPKDTFLCYYGCEHGWYRVAYDGYIGYINGDYVELS